MAGVIAGVFGFPFGWVVAIIVVRVTGGGAWLAWLLAVAFAAYGFLAPTRSRDMLTEIWQEIIGYFFKDK